MLLSLVALYFAVFSSGNKCLVLGQTDIRTCRAECLQQKVAIEGLSAGSSLKHLQLGMQYKAGCYFVGEGWEGESVFSLSRPET